MRAPREYGAIATVAVTVMGLALAACTQPIIVEWRYDLGAPSMSTPLVTDDLVAAGSEKGLVIVDLEGRLRCAFDSHGEVISAPRTDGTRIYFGSTNYNFYAIGTDCSEAWRFPTRDRIKSDPLVVSGRVVLSSYDGHVYALDAATGARIWTFPSEGRDIGDFSYSSPSLHDGVVYLGNLDSRLYAIDFETGALKWTFETQGSVTSTPRVHEGIVYFGSNDGNIYAVDTKSHELVWKVITRDWVNSSPYIDGKTLYIGGNDRNVYAIDIAAGRPIWSHPIAGPAIAIPTPYENLVFAAGASGDGSIYALQETDGSLFWQFETGGKILSDPVLAGNRLYVTSTDGMLYAFRIKSTRAQ